MPGLPPSFIRHPRSCRGFTPAPSWRRTPRSIRNAGVGPLAVIGARTRIGAGAMIGPHCVIGADVVVAAQVRLVARVTLCDGVSVGARSILHPGCVVGSDGFGFAPERGTWLKVPQVGSVRIGADVEIGANTTIDRGAIGDTVIGARGQAR